MKAVVFGLVVSLVLGFSASAQGVGDEDILFPPEDTDSRLWIVSESLSPYKIQIGSPYNYGMEQDSEWLQIVQLARWGCALYGGQRVAYVALDTSNTRCDEMGAIAAERDYGCFHTHTFACVK